jgi:hypothetical protein
MGKLPYYNQSHGNLPHNPESRPMIVRLFHPPFAGRTQSLRVVHYPEILA